MTVAVGLAHLDVLVGNRVFYYEDFTFWFAPTRSLVAEAWRTGSLPQWNPWVVLGEPLAANPAAAPLYPLNVLQLLGEPLAGLHRMIVFHLWLGGAAMYALARDRGARASAAFVASIGFAFSGPLLCNAQENAEHVFSLAWLPLSLLCYLRGVERRSLRWAVTSGAAMALMLLGGEPQVWYYNTFTLVAVGVAYVVASPPETRLRAAGGALGHLTVVVLAALVLSSAQLAVTLPSLSESQRMIGGAHYTDASRLKFTLHPLRLLTYGLPYLTGLWLPENSLWGNGLSGSYRYWVPSLYLGLVPVIFAPSALQTGSRRALSVALLALTVFFLLMAVGARGGVYSLADRIVPGLSMFRYPEKWAAATPLPLCLLGALGLEAVLDHRRTRAAVFSASLWGGLALLAVVAAGALRPLILEAAFFPAPGLADAAVRRIEMDGGHALVVALAVLVLLVLLARGKLRTALFTSALACVALADVVRVGLVPLGLSPPEIFHRGPMVSSMQAIDPHARFLRIPQPARVPVPVDEAGYLTSQMRQRWTGALYSLVGQQRVVQVYSMHSLGNVGAVVDGAIEGAHRVEGAALFGTRFYIVSDHEPPPSWLRPHLSSGRFVARFADAELGVVLEDLRALPRAYRAGLVEVRAGAHDAEALRSTLASGFDFHGSAIVHAAEALVDGKLVEVPAQPLDGLTARGGETSLVRDDASVVEVATRGNAPALLVLSDAFASGWRASVDGIGQPIHRANFAVRGVYVPAGEHMVRFEYVAPWLRLGLVVNLVGFLLAVGWLGWPVRVLWSDPSRT